MPAPVIQHLWPVMRYPLDTSSMRVSMSVAAEPAAGSLMAMAGFSPSRIQGNQRRF